MGFYQNMPRIQGQTLGHLSQIIFPDFPWDSKLKYWNSLTFQKVKIFPDGGNPVLVQLKKNATWRWSEPTCKFQRLFLSLYQSKTLWESSILLTLGLTVAGIWILVKSHPDRHTYIQKATHKSPPCMRTGGLKNWPHLQILPADSRWQVLHNEPVLCACRGAILVDPGWNATRSPVISVSPPSISTTAPSWIAPTWRSPGMFNGQPLSQQVLTYGKEKNLFKKKKKKLQIYPWKKQNLFKKKKKKKKKKKNVQKKQKYF